MESRGRMDGGGTQASPVPCPASAFPLLPFPRYLLQVDLELGERIQYKYVILEEQVRWPHGLHFCGPCSIFHAYCATPSVQCDLPWLEEVRSRCTGVCIHASGWSIASLKTAVGICGTLRVMRRHGILFMETQHLHTYLCCDGFYARLSLWVSVLHTQALLHMTSPMCPHHALRAGMDQVGEYQRRGRCKTA